MKKTNKTILVIEDNADITNVIKTLLKINNISAVFATNGKEAYALLSNMEISLVLCDVLLPDFDGYDILKGLKNNIETKNILFIFLTAIADPIDIKKGLKLGADDYITKPFLAKTLLDTIHSKLNTNTTK
ncbi:MAG: response regulator [Bacteroidia bacterium]